MKEPLHFNSREESGNIFFILGMARAVMQKQRRITEYNDMWQEVQNSGSYEAALKIIGKHVPLIDDATKRGYGA
jgi:hypothetical protein